MSRKTKATLIFMGVTALILGIVAITVCAPILHAVNEIVAQKVASMKYESMYTLWRKSQLKLEFSPQKQVRLWLYYVTG
jgi:hypothetical protein